MEAITVSLINMKGGVGKTTLAAQLALNCERRGMRTLAVDLDPQANLSQFILTPQDYARHLIEQKPTIIQIFDQYSPPTKKQTSPRLVDIRKLFIHGDELLLPNLDLLPSRLELSQTLKNPTGKERELLALALAQVADQYDLIIIDCAPTESILTQAAYHASRYVLVPVKPEFLATIGLPLLARSLRDFKSENSDHEIEVCGIVFNRSSTYFQGPEAEKAIKQVKEEARKNKWNVFETEIRYSASYAKAAREGADIGRTSYAHAPVIKEFSRFVEEFLSTIKFPRS